MPRQLIQQTETVRKVSKNIAVEARKVEVETFEGMICISYGVDDEAADIGDSFYRGNRLRCHSPDTRNASDFKTANGKVRIINKLSNYLFIKIFRQICYSLHISALAILHDRFLCVCPCVWASVCMRVSVFVGVYVCVCATNLRKCMFPGS